MPTTVIETITDHALHPWPDNRPLEDLRAVDVESLGLTFGEPPVLGGPYAPFERRALATLDALSTRCEDEPCDGRSSEGPAAPF